MSRSTRQRLHDLRRAVRATLAPRPFDLVVVVAAQNRGWILDAIGREVAQRAPGRVHIEYGDRIPPARAYLFMHYELHTRHVHQLRRSATSVVWFTHPNYDPDGEARVVRALRRATFVASMCSPHAATLAAAGVPAGKIKVVLPGADPALFRPHVRGRGVIGFNSAYYRRKRPDLIVDIVRAMPNRRFRLLGRSWEGTDELAALRRLPNFDYLEGTYDTYPQFYDGIDVFVSPSALEGGPVPLLEAMMANAVPVASDTGFARDLIVDGENGYVCGVDAGADDYAAAIETALASTADIRHTVEHLSWPRFATEMLGLLGLSHK